MRGCAPNIERLFETERPALVETISWAAGNGDRSENGDYIYGRKRLREIDRTLDRLSKKMAKAQVVDPSKQTDRGRVFFGATVTIADEDDEERIVTHRRRSTRPMPRPAGSAGTRRSPARCAAPRWAICAV